MGLLQVLKKLKLLNKKTTIAEKKQQSLFIRSLEKYLYSPFQGTKNPCIC